ncbi:TetR/AcrR family transcriptional regulator [Nocardia sp. NBC_01503]|uniref:TetR/AcrR family transcriptional regulator n=1 Tax=Nocardia sp. NBC_01503 TaxID=2975997 RepID=UPI002E7C393E|nr:helix-turn-helix domain-containing protein [Nocardia sp. NBC_01503]WTL33476.1 TetR/AcrR family transcriptional regulator [Nocardia sp. NBC_01503]
MTAPQRSTQVGRRARGMQDKQSRIFDAAAELFAEHGFARVTTQQISDRADIAAGTLFRYASSKGELLLMVYNADFRTALDLAEHRARAHDDPVETVLEIIRPTVRAAARNAENTIAYQRELLFGTASEKYRAEGLALVARMEAMIADRLAVDARARGLDSPRLEEFSRLAGRSVFAVLHLTLARPATGAHPGYDPLADLRAQIAQIVAGFFAALHAAANSEQRRDN